AIGLLQPAQDHRGVEPARIGEHYLFHRIGHRRVPFRPLTCGVLSPARYRGGKHVWPRESTFDDRGIRFGDAGRRTDPRADDGGVRRHIRGSTGEVTNYAPGTRCTPARMPVSLTITNGVIRSTGDPGWEGTVNPQGGLAELEVSPGRRPDR